VCKKSYSSYHNPILFFCRKLKTTMMLVLVGRGLSLTGWPTRSVARTAANYLIVVLEYKLTRIGIWYVSSGQQHHHIKSNRENKIKNGDAGTFRDLQNRTHLNPDLLVSSSSDTPNVLHCQRLSAPIWSQR